MRRVACILVISITLLLAVGGIAAAAAPDEAGSIEVANLVTWATSDPPNWALGGLYAGLGLVGALITIFALIGSAIPGTAGYAAIVAGLARLEERERVLDSLLAEPLANSSAIKHVGHVTNELRDDLAASRRRQYAWAAFVYAALGAFFASLLAQDMLQALVIGAGWTAYLGALGLKSEHNEIKAVKNEASLKLEAALVRANQKLMDANIQPADTTESLDALIMEAGVARAL